MTTPATVAPSPAPASTPVTTGATPTATAGPAVNSKAAKLAALQNVVATTNKDGSAKIPAIPGASTTITPTAGAVEGQVDDQTQQTNATQKDPIEAELDALLPSDSDFVDLRTAKIVVDGVETTFEKALNDAPFVLDYKGQEKTVVGIDNLIKMAQMGFASTENNLKAKQVILDADKVIKSFDKEKVGLIQKGVSEALDAKFLGWERGILEGVFPNGQRIQTIQQQSAAVADLKALKSWFLNGNQNAPLQTQGASGVPAQSLEDVRAQLQAEMDQKYQEQLEQLKLEQNNSRSAASVQALFEEVVKPFAGKLLKPDGKTVNMRLYQNFQRDTQLTAAKMAEQVLANYPKGLPVEVQRAIIKRAAVEVYKDYGVSTPAPVDDKNKVPGAPPLRTGSGAVAPKPPSKGPTKKSALWGTTDWFKNKRAQASLK